MPSDRWLTYAEAADLLGMTSGSVRNRAANERWEKSKDAQGKAIVMVPPDAIAYAIDDAGTKARKGRPREPKPVDDASLASEQINDLMRRVAELEADLAVARSERDQERADRLRERERADRATAETAEVALRLAATVEESRTMAKADRRRADAADADLAEAKHAHQKEVERLQTMLARMIDIHDFVQLPRWRQAITSKPPSAIGFDTMAFRAERSPSR